MQTFGTALVYDSPKNECSWKNPGFECETAEHVEQIVIREHDDYLDYAEAISYINLYSVGSNPLPLAEIATHLTL